MQILFNELSIEEQFPDVMEFRKSISTVLSMRREIKDKASSELRCHRILGTEKINRDMTVTDAVLCLDLNIKRAVLNWLSMGPFWDGEEQSHFGHQWLQVGDEIVTDTSVGEAAWLAMSSTGEPSYLVSLAPSRWEYTPVDVELMHPGSEHQVDKTATVTNIVDNSALAIVFGEMVGAFKTWPELGAHCRRVYSRLKFSDGWFEPMKGIPYSPYAAQHICNRLRVLNDLMNVRVDLGQDSPEYSELFRAQIVDGNWFSDESEANRNKFRKELTFEHPDRPTETLFCSWHAKVNFQFPIRIHFKWHESDSPIYVVYAGKHIT